MKTSFAVLAALAVALVLLAGQAFAGSRSAARTVTVAMHDPGCHWFATGGGFTKSLSVKGPIVLVNRDIATLKVAGAKGLKRDPVGKKITLTRGSYRITMVGQAPDDNTLKLVVR